MVNVNCQLLKQSGTTNTTTKIQCMLNLDLDWYQKTSTVDSIDNKGVVERQLHLLTQHA